jgi:putative PIN family toxin of toxin-antitoxin system
MDISETKTVTMIPNRVVIDTNVCLDLFVFHDNRYQSLLGALRNGRLQAVTSEHCRKEWLFILSYPHLPLNEESKAAAIAEYDALITLASLELALAGITLPACKDKEDQKFMELAHKAKAAVLITKDKALLKLAKRTARMGLFAIVSPDAWVREESAT